MENERGVGVILKWMLREWGGGVAWIIVARDWDNWCAVLHIAVHRRYHQVQAVARALGQG